jgi:tRNA uridine 5-carboxymethylaminomethyl modification enzyme
MKTDQFDVIVVGAGHAGIEACLAASRMGSKTLILTLNLDHIGQMSCNPAIGGIGKGHLVREIDALGGEMGRAIDETGIQFRRLNTKKGPAVRASRAQADKSLYRQRMKRVLENCSGLTIRQGSVESLLVKNSIIEGVETQIGEKFFGRTVILTTGTFLKGLVHVGSRNYPAGRAGDFAVQGLSQYLADYGLKVGRLKTGTCPRLDARTIDFSRLQVQEGDPDPIPFSFSNLSITQKQVPCHITYTNGRTHELIRSAIHLSPMYSGLIQSRGPRYCPSIEDKVVRFADKTRHQIFLEPEGLDTVEVYPNGISTSLPLDIQIDLVHSIEGLESAAIMRPGYAIEYDYVEPTQLSPSLETKLIRGLYHAGQINGTTGYEEAAAQGLIAGINAALSNRGEDPLILGRDQAYIGVLIDDLVTKGTDAEPYRMFTSRAEYRLMLREDNADLRLTEIGYGLGAVSKVAYDRLKQKQSDMAALADVLNSFQLTPSVQTNSLLVSLGSAPIVNKSSLAQILRRPELTITDLIRFAPIIRDYPSHVATQLEVAVKYAGYLHRQTEMINRSKNMEMTRLPGDIDYAVIDGLSREVREKLNCIRPLSIGQAARIPGITPAAISLISVYLKKSHKRREPTTAPF